MLLFLIYGILIIGDGRMKKGFIPMAVVYVFLVVFLLLMASILGKYVSRNTLTKSLQDNVKVELNKEYFNE